MVIRQTIILSVLALVCGVSLPGQESNPFELTPRMEQPAAEEAVLHDTGNPFDIIPPKEAPVRQRPTVELEPSPVEVESSPEQRLLLITNIVLFLLLSVLITFFRSQLKRAYRAFLNDNMLGQLQRERETVGGLPYYLFYLLFFFSAGFFVFLLCREYNITIIRQSPWLSLLLSVGLITLFFLGKHLLLSLFAYIFPVEKEVKLYSLTIIVFSIIMALILLPGNLFLSFAPESLTRGIALTLLLALALIYIFRSLRALFIGNKYLLFHKFHFLLYICTVEVAPIVIIVRLFLG